MLSFTNYIKVNKKKKKKHKVNPLFIIAAINKKKKLNKLKITFTCVDNYYNYFFHNNLNIQDTQKVYINHIEKNVKKTIGSEN